MCRAIARHDTAAIFDWLVSALSFQGISDRAAEQYMARHGTITWRDIERSLAQKPSCPKLQSYWHFHGCRYHKGHGTCAEPVHGRNCPLPTHDLRNGRLNQTAYSLHLFIRDVVGSDIVAWIDRRLKTTRHPKDLDRSQRMAEAIVGPLKEVYGVSDKVLAMCLSAIMLAAPRRRRSWFAVGTSMIAIDTLVHAFLHRSGILRGLGAEHQYGPRCYHENGCLGVLRAVTERVDASRYNTRYPARFPRFVQHSIWSYCAQNGLDICNGNRIDDRRSCGNIECQIYGLCGRKRLIR